MHAGALAPVPDFILEALHPPAPTNVFSFPTIASPNAPAPVRLAGIIRTVALAQPGERNALTFWGACRIRDMIAIGELRGADANNAFSALYEAARRTGLNHHEITNTIGSATGRRRA
jgi:hypothetical protein